MSRHRTQQVYLAGPMPDPDPWRPQARRDLEAEGLIVVQPELLAKYTKTFGVTFEQAQRILTDRDRKFATQSDFVLVNFDCGDGSISRGTCIELGWADLSPNVTTVTVLPEDDPHVHPMVINVSDYVVRELDDATELIAALAWRNT